MVGNTITSRRSKWSGITDNGKAHTAIAALLQLAKQCNAECKQAVSQDQPTFPILTRYAQQANNIGASQARLVYQLAVLNGHIKPK